MDRIRVVLVEPRYQVNLGYVARALMNFGVRELHIINPKCKVTGKQAIKYAKHAHTLLRNARTYSGLQKLPRHGMLIGTTGIWHKTERSYTNVYNLQDLGRLAKGWKLGNRKLTLLIGREGTGLTKEELAMCDASIFIATNLDYPIMNVSHALAVVLYALTSKEMLASDGLQRDYAESQEIGNAIMLFSRLVRSNLKIKNKRSVIAAFGHILNRAAPTRKEASAIAVALAGVRE